MVLLLGFILTGDVLDRNHLCANFNLIVVYVGAVLGGISILCVAVYYEMKRTAPRARQRTLVWGQEGLIRHATPRAGLAVARLGLMKVFSSCK